MTELKPFLKVVGGKRKLAQLIAGHMPMQISHYSEPFCGGSAVFCELWNTGRLAGTLELNLSDLNLSLISAYNNVRTRPELVDQKLAAYKTRYDAAADQRAFFNLERACWNQGERSTCRHIFLRMTAYNGLWRENKKGEMNAPWGKYKTFARPSSELLQTWSDALRRARISVSNWKSAVVDSALGITGPNNVFYFDPPYYGTFSSYTKEGFDAQEHIELIKTCSNLAKQGITVLLSNSADSFVRENVKKYWKTAKVEEIYARRSINCKGDGRGEVKELLIYA